MNNRPRRNIRKRKLSEEPAVIKVVPPVRAHKKPRTTKVAKTPAPSQARQVVPFVETVLDMLADPRAKQYIQWTKSGDSFVCPNPELLAKNVLGRFFKHSNFSSFVRQLNMYGWNKTSDSSTFEFANPCFKRDEPELLPNIQRRRARRSSADATSRVVPQAPTKASKKSGKTKKRSRKTHTRPASHAAPSSFDYSSIPAPTHLAQPVPTVTAAPEISALFRRLSGESVDAPTSRPRRSSSDVEVDSNTDADEYVRKAFQRRRRSSQTSPLTDAQVAERMAQIRAERTGLQESIRDVQEERKALARETLQMSQLNERLYKDLLASRRHQLGGIRKIQSVFANVKALAAKEGLTAPSMEAFPFPTREKLHSLRPGPRPRLSNQPKDLEALAPSAFIAQGSHMQVPPSPSTLELAKQRSRAPGFMSPPVQRLFQSPYSEAPNGPVVQSTLASPLTATELAMVRTASATPTRQGNAHAAYATSSSSRLHTPRLNVVRGESESFEQLYGIPDYDPVPVNSLTGSSIFFGKDAAASTPVTTH